MFKKISYNIFISLILLNGVKNYYNVNFNFRILVIGIVCYYFFYKNEYILKEIVLNFKYICICIVFYDNWVNFLYCLFIVLCMSCDDFIFKFIYGSIGIFFI